MNTLSESVVMLMEGFLVVTAVLEPHLLLRPAAVPDSCSPSALPVPGEDLLSGKTKEKKTLWVNPTIISTHILNSKKDDILAIRKMAGSTYYSEKSCALKRPWVPATQEDKNRPTYRGAVRTTLYVRRQMVKNSLEKRWKYDKREDKLGVRKW